MRRYNTRHYSPPRRGHGGRGRSPPRRGYGRHSDHNQGSLLVRNIPLDCRPEELRVPFERFGLVRDVYIPKDYYTGKPRGFAFVQFVDPYEAAEAQYRMNGQFFAGREISVVVALQSRKKPEEMRETTSVRRPPGHGGQRSYYGHARFRSHSPRYPPSSRSRYRSRSYSPGPKRESYYSVSPSRRHMDHARSPQGHPSDRDDHQRSYSPSCEITEQNQNDDGYRKRSAFESEDAGGHWKAPGRRRSRSPPF